MEERSEQSQAFSVRVFPLQEEEEEERAEGERMETPEEVRIFSLFMSTWVFDGGNSLTEELTFMQTFSVPV